MTAVDCAVLRVRIPADLLSASRDLAENHGLTLDLWVQRALEMAKADPSWRPAPVEPSTDDLLAALRRRLGLDGSGGAQ